MIKSRDLDCKLRAHSTPQSRPPHPSVYNLGLGAFYIYLVQPSSVKNNETFMKDILI
jgi:hypothetical protein